MSPMPQTFHFIPGEWCVIHPQLREQRTIEKCLLTYFGFLKFVLYEENEIT